MEATPKQLDYLLALANRRTGESARYLSQNRWLKETLTMRERGGSISKARASALIDQLLKEAM